MPNDAMLTGTIEDEEEKKAKEQGQQDYVTGVVHIADNSTLKGEGYVSPKGLYQQTVGVTKYDQLRKMVGLKDGQSYTDWYKMNGGRAPIGYEMDSRALLAEEKAKRYADQYERGEIGYSDFLMKAYGKDIMKANGDDLTNPIYWYNRAKQGLYNSPLDNDYYLSQVLDAAEKEWQASEWYKEIYTKDANDLLAGLVTGVTLNAKQFSEIFPGATEALSNAFDDDIEKIMTYYRAGYLDVGAFNPLIDVDDDGKYDYYYHTDGKLYAIEGTSGKGTKWARASYNDDGSIDHIVVDMGYGKDGFGEYANEFFGGFGSFWGGIVDLFAMIGAGIATLDGKTYSDHYAEWEKIKNSTWSVALGGAGNVRDFGGQLSETGQQDKGDNIGRGVVRAVGAIVPMIIMTLATAGTAPAAEAAGKAAGETAKRSVGQAIKSFTIKGIQTLSGMRGGSPAITNAIAAHMVQGSVKQGVVRMIGGAAERAAILAVKDAMSTYISLEARRRQLQAMKDNGADVEVYDKGYMVGRAVTVALVNSSISFMMGAMSGIGGMTDRADMVSKALEGKTDWLSRATKGVADFISNKVFAGISTGGLIANSVLDVAENIITQTTLAWGQAGDGSKAGSWESSKQWGQSLVGIISDPSSWVMNMYIFAQDIGLGGMIDKHTKKDHPFWKNALGATSLKEDAMVRIAGTVDWNEKNLAQPLQVALAKYVNEGDVDAANGIRVLLDTFNNRCNALEIKNDDGTTTIRDAYTVKLEAIRELAQAFTINSADEATMQKQLLDNLAKAGYVTQKYADETKALIDTGKADSFVTALMQKELRDKIKVISIAQMEHDQKLMNAVFGAEDNLMRIIFGGNDDGQLKPKTRGGKANMFGMGTAHETIKQMFSATGSMLSPDSTDLRLMLTYEERITELMGADSVIALDEEQFNADLEYAYATGVVSPQGKYTYDEDGNLRLEAEFSKDKITDDLIKSLGSDKNESARKLLIGMGILPETQKDSNPLLGALILREKAPAEYGEGFNKAQSDPRRQKLMKTLEIISNFAKIQNKDGAPLISYSKPPITKVTLFASDGKTQYDLFILPAYSSFARVTNLAAVGSMVRSMLTLSYINGSGEADRERVNYSLMLLGMCSDENLAEDPVHALQKSIKNEKGEAADIQKEVLTKLRERGLSIVLRSVDLSKDQSESEVMSRNQLIKLIENGAITRGEIDKVANDNLEDKSIQQIKTYVSDWYIIRDDIYPILDKIKKAKAEKQDKVKLTQSEQDKFEKFAASVKSRGGLSDAVFQTLLKDLDGAIRADLINAIYTDDLSPFASGQRNLGLLALGDFFQGLTRDESLELDEAKINKYLNAIEALYGKESLPRYAVSLTQRLSAILNDDSFRGKFIANVESDAAVTLENGGKLRETQEKAINIVLDSLSKVKSFPEMVELYDKLTGPDSVAAFDELFEKAGGYLEWNAENPVNEAERVEHFKRKSDIDLKRSIGATLKKLISPDAIKFELGKAFLGDSILHGDYQLLMDGYRTSKGYTFQEEVRNNPELQARLYEVIEQFRPSDTDLTRDDFRNRPLYWIRKVLGIEEKKAGATNFMRALVNKIVTDAPSGAITWRERSVIDEIHDMLLTARDIYYTDTVALAGERKIKVNLNQIHGKAVAELLAKCRNDAYMNSLMWSQNFEEFTAREKDVYWQEHALFTAIKNAKAVDGIMTFDMDDADSMEQFKQLMDRLGYSASEVLAAKHSNIDGVYTMEQATRGIRIPVDKNQASVLIEALKKEATNVEYLSAAIRQIHMTQTLNERALGYIYFDENTVLENPRAILENGAEFKAENIFTGEQKIFNEYGVKLGVAASRASKFLAAIMPGFATKRGAATELDNVIKLISFTETLGEALKSEDTHKIITQSFAAKNKANEIATRYNDNKIWRASVNKTNTEDGTEIWTVVFTLRNSNGDFAADALELLSDGKHFVTDVLPLFYYTDEDNPVDNPMLTKDNAMLTRIGDTAEGKTINEGMTKTVAGQPISSFIISNSPYEFTPESLLEYSRTELRFLERYSFSKDEYKSLVSGPKTVSEIIKLAKKSKNVYVKTLANILKMGMQVTDIIRNGALGVSIPDEWFPTDADKNNFLRIYGDPSFRIALGNALNNKEITGLEHGIATYKELESLLASDNDAIKKIVAEVKKRWVADANGYHQATINPDSPDDIPSSYSKDIIDTSVLWTIGSKYKLDVKQEDLDGLIERVVTGIIASIHDYHTDPEIPKSEYQFQKLNPATKLLQLLRSDSTGENYYFDVNTLDELEDSHIELLQRLLGDAYKGSDLEKKINATDEFRRHAIRETEDKLIVNTRAQTNTSRTTFDVAVATSENEARMIELVRNSLINKSYQKMRIKFSSILNGQSTNGILVDNYIKRLNQTVMGNYAVNNPGSYMAVNMNNRLAAGSYFLSLIQLSESLLATQTKNGNTLFGATFDERAAFEVAEAIALYSSGTEYSNEYTRYLIYDSNAPEGQRVRPFGMTFDRADGATDMFANLLTGGKEFDTAKQEWIKNDRYYMKQDGRSNGLVLIDVGRNALVDSHGEFDQTVRYANLSEEQTRIGLYDAATLHFCYEYQNNHRYGYTGREPVEFITAASKVIGYTRASSVHYAYEELMQEMRELFPHLSDSQIRENILPNAATLSSASARETHQEEGFRNYAAAKSIVGVNSPAAMTYDMQLKTDLLAFGVTRNILPESIQRALTNIPFFLDELAGTPITDAIKEYANLMMKPRIKDMDGNLVISPRSREEETRADAVLNGILNEFKNAQGEISDEDKMKVYKAIVAYTITSRQRGKDLSAIMNSKTNSIYDVISTGLGLKKGMGPNYVEIELSNKVKLAYNELLSRGAIVFDIESFYDPDDDTDDHIKSKVWQISFARYKSEYEYTDYEKKAEQIDTIFIRHGDDVLRELKQEGSPRTAGQLYYSGTRELNDKYRAVIAIDGKETEFAGIKEISYQGKTYLVAEDEAAAVAWVNQFMSNNVAQNGEQGKALLLGYNSSQYDIPVLSRLGVSFADYDHLDVLNDIARKIFTSLNVDFRNKKQSLDGFRERFGIDLATGHDADEDVQFTLYVMKRLLMGIVDTNRMRASLSDDLDAIGEKIFGLKGDALGIKLDSMQRDTLFEDIRNHILKNIPEADAKYIEEFGKFDGLKNQQIQDVIQRLNDIESAREHRVLMKKYFGLIEDIVGSKRAREFVDYFHDIKNRIPVTKVLATVLNRLNETAADKMYYDDKIEKGILILASQIFANIAAGDSIFSSDYAQKDFLQLPMEEQIDRINDYIASRSSRHSQYDGVDYQAIASKPITIEEVQDTDITELQKIISIATDRKSGRTYATDDPEVESRSSIIDLVRERQLTFGAQDKYEYAMVDLYKAMGFANMSVSMQKYFRNKFAEIYLKDYDNQSIVKRNNSIVIQSWISENLRDYVLQERDYTLDTYRAYDQIVPRNAGTKIHLADGSYETVQAGTLYLSEKEFKRIYGSNVSYESLLETIRVDDSDKDIYAQMMRHPGFREDILHTVKIKIVNKDTGINTFAADPNWFYAMCSGDFDGDCIMLLAPTKETQIFGRNMHQATTAGWSMVNAVLTHAFQKSYAESSQALAFAEKLNEVFEKRFLNVWHQVNNSKYSIEEKRQYIASLKEMMQAEHARLRGWAIDDEKAKAEFKSIWKIIGITSYDDSVSNATNGGTKWISYSSLLSKDDINKKNGLARMMGGFCFFNEMQLVASIPGVGTKDGAGIDSRLEGNPSDIFVYSPINFTKETIAQLQAALTYDVDARRNISNALEHFAKSSQYKTAITELRNSLLKDPDAYAVVNALQILEYERRNSSKVNDLMVEAFKHINNDDIARQEISKLNALKESLKQQGVDVQNAMKDAGITEMPDEQDPAYYIKMKLIRSKLMRAYYNGREAQRFAGARDTQMQRVLSAAMLDSVQDSIGSYTRVYDELGTKYKYVQDDEQTIACGKEFTVLVCDDATIPADGIFLTKPKSDMYDMISAAQVTLDGRQEINEEIIQAYISGKRIQPGSKILTGIDAKTENLRIKVGAILDEHNNTIEAKDLRNDPSLIKRARAVIYVRDHNLTDQAGGYKLTLLGSAALKCTVAGMAPSLPKGITDDIDFITNEEMFKGDKISNSADYHVETRIINGKQYRVIKGIMGIAAQTATWGKGFDTSDFDEITLVNARSSADSYLSIGRHSAYIKDGKVVIDTGAAANIRQALEDLGQPEYMNNNAASLYRSMLIYFLTEDAISHNVIDNESFLKIIGVNPRTIIGSKNEDALIKIERDKWFERIASSANIGGQGGISMFNRLLNLIHKDASGIAKFRARMEKDKFGRVLFSKDLSTKFENGDTLAVAQRNKGVASRNNGLRSAGIDERYFTINEQKRGVSADESIARSSGRRSMSLGYYPMLRFINDLLYGIDADNMTDNDEYGPSYISAETAKILTRKGYLNLPAGKRGDLAQEYNPVGEYESYVVDRDPTGTAPTQKTGTANGNIDRLISMGVSPEVSGSLENFIMEATASKRASDVDIQNKYMERFNERYMENGWNSDKPVQRRYNEPENKKARSSRGDRMLYNILVALAPVDSKLGRAALMTDTSDDVRLNVQETNIGPSNGELQYVSTNETRTVPADEVFKQMNDGSYNYFNRFKREKVKAKDIFDEYRKDMESPYSAIVKLRADEMGKGTINQSEGSYNIPEDMSFTRADFDEHAKPFLQQATMYESFVNQMYEGRTIDTKVESAAKYFQRISGDEVFRGARSWWDSSGIKSADEDDERTQEIQRALVEYRASGREFYNEMLGDPFVMLARALSSNKATNDAFNKYARLKAMIARLEDVETRQAQVAQAIKRDKKYGTYEKLHEAMVKDIGNIDKAKSYINLYEQTNKGIVTLYKLIMTRVKQQCITYAKLTGQPIPETYWFAIPKQEEARRNSDNKLHKGDITLLVMLGGFGADRNLPSTIMNRNGENPDDIYMGYDFMSSISATAMHLSKIMAQCKLSEKLRKSDVMSNTIIRDTLHNLIGNYFNDLLETENGKVIPGDYNDRGKKGGAAFHDFSVYQQTLIDSGFDTPITNREIESAGGVSKISQGKLYAWLYLDMISYMNSAKEFQGKSYSDLVAMWQSAETDEARKAYMKGIKAMSAIDDIIVKLSELKDKKNSQNIMERIYNATLKEAEKQDLVFVDKFGRKFDVVKGIDWYAFSENSYEWMPQLYRYQAQVDGVEIEGGVKANAVIDMLNGDLYLMDRFTAEHLSNTVFTRVEPGLVRKIMRGFKNIATTLIMSSPVKLLSRMFNFSVSDVGFAMTADPLVGKKLSEARREIAEFMQSKGAKISEDLKAYMSLVSVDGAMFRGEETVNGSKVHVPGISDWFEFSNKMFNAQTMYVRLALFKSLSQRYSEFTGENKSGTKKNNGIIPAYRFGADYRIADTLNKMQATKGDIIDGVGATKAQRIAAKVVADTFGNNGDMPYIARALSERGFAFTTFPLALVRFAGKELSSFAYAARDLFTGDGATKRGALAQLGLQTASVLGAYAISLILQLLGDSEKREAVWDAITGEDLDEEKKEALKSFLLNDSGAIKPLESMLAGETQRNKSLQLTPLGNLRQMFVSPFENAAKGQTQQGASTDIGKVPLSFLNFFNENIYSHLPTLATLPFESIPSQQMFGYSYGNDDYSWFENLSRRISGYMFGSEVTNAFMQDWKTSGYEENLSFLGRLRHGLNRAFIEELGNSKEYKSAWKNYRKAFSFVYEYKRNTQSTLEATYQDPAYDELSQKLRLALQNKNTPTAFYEIIAEAKQNGTALATIRSAVNNCSLRYKISRLENQDDFYDSLSDNQFTALKAALAYEDYMFPFLDEAMEQVEDEYYKAGGYRSQYQNALNTYYNGFFHNLPSNATYSYTNNGAYRNNSYFGYNNNYQSGYNPRRNPFEAYRDAAYRLQQQQYQLQRERQAEQYTDRTFKP